MDPRISTAPAQGSKKWARNPSSSCLLRQPSAKAFNGVRLEVPAVAETHRPNTCPVPTLTPQFHWNLNNSTLKTLTRHQVQQLYGLFTFYDSSTIGDDLPSINCARLVEILQDARLLSDGSSNNTINPPISPMKCLHVDCIERIFAQAVMGKMRVYLDADGQPALTFPLFCGALMNCAMLLTPLAHPEAALRQILPILLEGSILNGNYASSAKGLLCHLPAIGSISPWTPMESHGSLEVVDTPQDFRELAPFQQVIADCTRDKVLDELKQDKLAWYYQIPQHLLASFHQDTIALISNKFRMFDVFDRGMLPRHEIFPLLSSLGKRADLPDPYAVLTKLSVSNAPQTANEGSIPASNSGDGSVGGELTLAQLLQAIESTRESKRHSITARLAAMRINNANRVDPAGSAPLGEISGVHKVGPASFSIEENVDDDTNENTVNIHKLSAQNNSSSTGGSKERGKRAAVTRSRSRRSIQAQGTSIIGIGNSSHALLSSKHHGGSKAHLAHHASVSGKKKGDLQRKPSSKVRKREATATDTDNAGLSIHSGSHTQRSTTTISSNSSDYNHPTVPTTGSGSPPSDEIGNDRRNQGDNKHIDHTGQFQSNAMAVQVHEPSTACNRKRIRIFLLLGGDHDGAICCTLSLVITTREITESEGIYYSTAPSETTRTTPILPSQTDLTNALLMLKKCVLVRQERGFELCPDNQLEAVDNMLLKLKKRQPRFSIALSPGARAAKTAALAAASGPAKPFSIKEEESVASFTSDFVPALKIESRPISSSTSGSSPLRHKPLSTSKSHQLKLPSNYRDLLVSWEVSQSDNCAWIHDVNAASPLKPASPLHLQTKRANSGHLSPLRFPSRQGY
ncbi:unnamed protein product [Phytophthora lilii]|uniref:Unnamed protein product n=1 Tax=Phytophthora lilii TaxID=2077276 RepID=A0A9W6UDK6_9STRA|nr:unnamed protein product [Phytophthora lilii]